jgi:predicted Zn-ribbon and HTH transcriptional regulator
MTHQKQIPYLEDTKSGFNKKCVKYALYHRTHLSKIINTIIMQTTGSCMKCGYQARPRKNQSIGTDTPTCPKCNNALT